MPSGPLPPQPAPKPSSSLLGCHILHSDTLLALHGSGSPGGGHPAPSLPVASSSCIGFAFWRHPSPHWLSLGSSERSPGLFSNVRGLLTVGSHGPDYPLLTSPRTSGDSALPVALRGLCPKHSVPRGDAGVPSGGVAAPPWFVDLGARAGLGRGCLVPALWRRPISKRSGCLWPLVSLCRRDALRPLAWQSTSSVEWEHPVRELPFCGGCGVGAPSRARGVSENRSLRDGFPVNFSAKDLSRLYLYVM